MGQRGRPRNSINVALPLRRAQSPDGMARAERSLFRQIYLFIQLAFIWSQSSGPFPSNSQVRLSRSFCFVCLYSLKASLAVAHPPFYRETGNLVYASLPPSGHGPRQCSKYNRLLSTCEDLSQCSKARLREPPCGLLPEAAISIKYLASSFLLRLDVS